MKGIILLLSIFLLIPTNHGEERANDTIESEEKGWPICEYGGSYALPHHTYCDRYFICQLGQPYLEQCEDGLGFVPHKGCKLLHLVNCTGRTKLQPSRGSDNCPHLYGLHAHPQRCNSYLQCENGTALTFNCTEGLVFDTEMKICRLPTELEKHSCLEHKTTSIKEFTCPKENGLPFGDHSRHPHPDNCKYFIMCLRDGSMKIGGCDKGLVFSTISNTCEAEDKTVCNT